MCKINVCKLKPKKFRNLTKGLKKHSRHAMTMLEDEQKILVQGEC